LQEFILCHGKGVFFSYPRPLRTHAGVLSRCAAAGTLG
jgi:hypothetical protein